MYVSWACRVTQSFFFYSLFFSGSIHTSQVPVICGKEYLSYRHKMIKIYVQFVFCGAKSRWWNSSLAFAQWIYNDLFIIFNKLEESRWNHIFTIIESNESSVSVHGRKAGFVTICIKIPAILRIKKHILARNCLFHLCSIISLQVVSISSKFSPM